MATAGSIVIDLLLRTGSIETDAARAEKRLKQLQKQVTEVGKTIGTAIGAGAAVAVGALATLTVQSINYADQLDELSGRLGVSTELLSAWGYAAKLSGTDLESLAGALPKLQRNLAAALNEGSRQAELFDALGISVTDAAGKLRDVEDVIPEIADRFKMLDSDTTEAALALELLGKNGTELLEFFNRGSGGLDDLAKRASALGVVIDEETAASAGAFNDKLGDLSELAKGLGIQIAAQLLPSLTKLVDEFGDIVREGGAAEKVVSGIKWVIDDVSTAFDQFNHLLQTTNDFFGGLKDIASSTLQVLGGFATFDWDKIQQGIEGRGLGLAKLSRSTMSFEEFQARKERQANPPGQMPSYLNLPDYLSGGPDIPFARLSSFSAVPESARVPAELTGEAKEIAELEARLRALLEGRSTAAGKATKATKELSEADKSWIDWVEEMAVVEGIWQEASAESVKAQGDRAKAIDDARARIDEQIVSMRSELDLLSATNRERQIEVDLRYAGAEATEEQKQQIAALSGSIYDQAQAIERQVDALDSVRGAAGGFLDDLKDGVGVFDALENAVDRLVDKLFDLAADGIIDQLLGQQGDTGTGSAGGWLSTFASMFGGARAGGGDVLGGRGYLVGEQGPELFIPRTAGMVLTADETASMGRGGGRGMSVTQVFNNAVMTDVRSESQRQQQAAQQLRIASARNG